MSGSTPFSTCLTHPYDCPQSTEYMHVRCLHIPANGSPIQEMLVEVGKSENGAFSIMPIIGLPWCDDPTRMYIVRTPRTFCSSLFGEDQAKQRLSPRLPRYMPNSTIHIYVATTSSSATSTPRRSSAIHTCSIASAGMHSFLGSTKNSANLKIPARCSALYFSRMCQTLCRVPIYWWR